MDNQDYSAGREALNRRDAMRLWEWALLRACSGYSAAVRFRRPV